MDLSSKYLFREIKTASGAEPNQVIVFLEKSINTITKSKNIEVIKYIVAASHINIPKI